MDHAELYKLLLGIFSDFSEEAKGTASTDVTVLSPKQIPQLLRNGLANTVRLICFENPLTMEALVQCVLGIHRLLNDKPLEKPLIIVLPILQTTELQKNSLSLLEKCQWSSCVILPKNYLSPCGQPTGNADKEVIFYSDSSSKQSPEQMPPHFANFFQILTQGCTKKQQSHDSKNVRETRIAPPFPQALFYNAGCHQQQTLADSRSWVVYNTLMIVLSGNGKFANKFTVSCKAPTNLLLQLLNAMPKIANVTSANSNNLTTLQQVPKVNQEGGKSSDEKLVEQKNPPVSSSKKELLSAESSGMAVKKDEKYAASDTKFEIKSSDLKNITIKSDSSLPIPSYSFSTIVNLLNVLHKEKEQIVIAKALDPYLFLLDNIRYFLKYREQASHRRVCFLLPGLNQEPLALIFQLSQLNKTQISKIQEWLQDEKTPHAESLAKEAKYQQAFQQLYGHVQTLFLGSHATDNLIKQLIIPFQLAYTGKVEITFKPPTLINPHVAFVDDCIQMLLKGETRELPTVDVYKQHHAHCVSILMSAINATNDYQKLIQEQAIILFKYMMLKNSREKYCSIKGNNLYDLEQLMAKDQRIKTTIFSSNIVDLEVFFIALDLIPLAIMASLAHEPQQLLQKLKESQMQQQKLIENWEQDLQSRIKMLNKAWFPYLQKQSKKIANFMYQNSMVSLSAEIINWVGQPVISSIPESWKFQMKDFALSSIKWATLCFTLSSRVARKSYHVADQIFNHSDTSFGVLKLAGASLGIMMIGSEGLYSTVRILTTSAITLFLIDHFNQLQFIDAKAMVKRRYRFQVDSIVLYRSLSLITSLFESLWFKEIQPLIYLMGGMSGSIVAVRAAKKLFPELRVLPGQLSTPDQTHFLFLISLAGHQFGYVISEYGYNFVASIIFKHYLQQQVIRQLREQAAEQQVADLVIESSYIPASPWLWFTASKQLRVEWRGRNNFFYHADCNINEIKTKSIATATETTLECVVHSTVPRITGL